MKRGFTLMELLTIVTIIGLVSAFSLVSLSQGRARARDDQRINDLKLIQQSLELYRIDVDRGTLAYIGDQVKIDQVCQENQTPTAFCAYPRRNSENKLPGIYDNPTFNQYLTISPKDPLTKKAYTYFSPACVHAGNDTIDNPTVISPAADGNFHSASDIASNSLICSTGSGWVPYALYTLLERSLDAGVRRVTLTNLATSNRAVIFSVTQPIFGSDPGAPATTVQNGGEFDSRCYPSKNGCVSGL